MKKYDTFYLDVIKAALADDSDGMDAALEHLPGNSVYMTASREQTTLKCDQRSISEHAQRLNGSVPSRMPSALHLFNVFHGRILGLVLTRTAGGKIIESGNPCEIKRSRCT